MTLSVAVGIVTFIMSLLYPLSLQKELRDTIIFGESRDTLHLYFEGGFNFSDVPTITLSSSYIESRQERDVKQLYIFADVEYFLYKKRGKDTLLIYADTKPGIMKEKNNMTSTVTIILTVMDSESLQQMLWNNDIHQLKRFPRLK
jgi:hypothetical protein